MGQDGMGIALQHSSDGFSKCVKRTVYPPRAASGDLDTRGGTTAQHPRLVDVRRTAYASRPADRKQRAAGFRASGCTVHPIQAELIVVVTLGLVLLLSTPLNFQHLLVSGLRVF